MNVAVKSCVKDLFGFCHDVNRELLCCYRINIIRVGICFVAYREDHTPALVSSNDLLQYKIPNYNFYNLKCWHAEDGWQELFNAVCKEKGWLIFPLGSKFPYELCQRMNMETLEQALNEDRWSVYKIMCDHFANNKNNLFFILLKQHSKSSKNTSYEQLRYIVDLQTSSIIVFKILRLI